jgi:hypothetical protein
MNWRTITFMMTLAVPAAAAAQAPPDAAPPLLPHVETSTTTPCVTRSTVGQDGGDIEVKTPQDKTLSQKLAQSNGVICPPPHVDPDMHHPAPAGGPMPVIPPKAVTPDAQAK